MQPTRSQTIGTIASSVYSDSSAPSLFSHLGSTSSASEHDCSLNLALSTHPSNEQVLPMIPPRYRPSMVYSLRNGGKPMRPRSRPPMPPAPFWEYAREEQQRCNDLLEDQTRKASQIIRPRRNTESARLDQNKSLPAVPAPPPGDYLPKELLRKSTDDDRRAQRASYGQIRKGVSMPTASPRSPVKADLSDVFDEFAAICDPGESGRGYQTEKPETRTLVKMRQPWDKKPSELHEIGKLKCFTH